MGHLTRGIIYYTDSLIPERLAGAVRETILAAGLPIVSSSRDPLAFGRNHVIEGPRGYVTYLRQILRALEASDTDVVFFAEHDVLYHPSHWDFLPPRLDTWYYDTHVWRWQVGADTAIRYDGMTPLSMCCVGQAQALAHYRARQAYVDAHPEQFVGRDPQVARRWGYEPGKPVKRGGIREERWATWTADGASLDLRHRQALTPAKVTLAEFTHPPTGWQAKPIKDFGTWNLSAIC